MPKATKPAIKDASFPNHDGNPAWWTTGPYGAVPTNDALDAAIELLKRDDPLPLETRRFLADVLDLFGLWIFIDTQEHHRGRRVAEDTWWAAWMAFELVKRYKVKVRVAVETVLGPGQLYWREPVERAYRKVKAGKSPTKHQFHPDVVARVATLLPPSKTQKAETTSRQ